MMDIIQTVESSEELVKIYCVFSSLCSLGQINVKLEQSRVPDMTIFWLKLKSDLDLPFVSADATGCRLLG